MARRADRLRDRPRCPHRQLPPRRKYWEGECTYAEYQADQVANPDPPAGYCDACWRAALARPFTTEEWAALHAQAREGYNGPENQYRPIKPYVLPKPPTPAKARTAAQITAAITPDPRGDKVLGLYAEGFRVVCTDGSRLLTVRDEAPGKSAPGWLTTYLNPSGDWIPLPTDFDLIVRRVAQLAGERTHAITLTRQDTYLEVHATGWDGQPQYGSNQGNWAKEQIPIPGELYAEARSICLNAAFLLDALGGPLELSITNTETPAVLRPPDDSWRYVQMGMRV